MHDSEKKNEIFLYQTDLIEKLEKEFKEELNGIKWVDSPANPAERIVMAKDNKRIKDKSKHTKYRSGVGMLLFSVKYSWTDISNAVRALSKVNFGPNPAHY